MCTFNLFSFLFQVRVVIIWLLLGPLFTAAVSIRNKIIFVFRKLPAHQPCRSRCQSSESTEFLCRRVWIYPTCIWSVGFFSWRRFCSSAGQVFAKLAWDKTKIMEAWKSILITTAVQYRYVFFFSFYLPSARWKYMHSITFMASLPSLLMYLCIYLFFNFLVCWMTVVSVGMIRVWCDTGREKLKYSEKNLYTCQFAHHRSHRD